MQMQTNTQPPSPSPQRRPGRPGVIMLGAALWGATVFCTLYVVTPWVIGTLRLAFNLTLVASAAMFGVSLHRDFGVPNVLLAPLTVTISGALCAIACCFSTVRALPRSHRAAALGGCALFAPLLAALWIACS
ncbi:hypothetical protein [Streptomyces turgidiscabies]|uniref:Integral membrane protein n=1 Tax=Streptomyces turgidiscabies TaxID=85558 RepID=A0ABU0RE37_9ACTN|nr:hypothetical protein [Streptomyces turgidiscabies]MDQ0930256.1 hypothetical protein [Streptomyces turgidiscabies]